MAAGLPQRKINNLCSHSFFITLTIKKVEQHHREKKMASRYRYGASKISHKAIVAAPMPTFSTKDLMERRRTSSGAYTVGESSFYDPSRTEKLSRNCLAFEYLNGPAGVFTFFNGEKTNSAQDLFKSVKFCGITHNEYLGPSPGIPSQTGKEVSIVVYGSLSIPGISPGKLCVGDKLRYCLPELDKTALLAQYQVAEVDLPRTDLVATVEEVPVDTDRLCLAQAASTESVNRTLLLSILKLGSLNPTPAVLSNIGDFLISGQRATLDAPARSIINKVLQFYANSEAQESHWAVRLGYNPLAGNTRANSIYDLMKEDPLAFILDHLHLLREENRTHFAYVVKEANEFGGDLDVLVKI